MPQHNTEVLIVGAGPTGLLAAIELYRRGRRVRIIDQNAGPSVHSKALGIQARTLEILEMLGLVRPFLAAGNPIPGVRMYSEQGQIAHIELANLHSNYPYILMLPQSETEQFFIEELSRKGISVERSTTLVDLEQLDNKVNVTLKGPSGEIETLTVPWVIGCDGAHSTVRHSVNATFEGTSAPQDFVLADICMDGIVTDNAVQLYLSHAGLLAVFPLGGGEYRLISTVPAGEDTDYTLERWQALASERGLAGAVLSNPKWLAAFHVSYRSTPQMHYGHVLLAGDAAHIHSPAGAQGMNTGLHDIHNLVWKLDLVMQGTAPESLLETYTSERHGVAKEVLRTTSIMTQTATIDRPFLRQLRDSMLPLLSGFRMVREQLTERISEIGISYRHSPLSEGAHGHVQPGDRAPDAPVRSADTGKDGTLFGLFGDSRHVALFIAGNDENGRVAARDAAATCRSISKYVAAYVVHESSRPPEHDVAVLIERDGCLRERYGAQHGATILVRPDGYIAWRGEPGDSDALHGYLNRHYGFEDLPREIE